VAENTLDIATKLKPEHGWLELFTWTHKDLIIDGILGRQDSVLVGRQAEETEPAFEVWGPDHILEYDDLDPSLANLVTTPCWQTSIVLQSDPREQDWHDAVELACNIAENCNGAVYYRETGKIVYPRGLKGQPTTTLDDSPKIDLVKLDWFVHLSEASVATAERFLSTLKQTCPEALPVRFGFHEPLEGRVPADNYGSFLKAWESGKTTEKNSLLFIKSKSPCLSGFVGFPFRFLGPVSPEGNLVKIRLDFDSRVLNQDPAWCEKVVRLFIELATNLNAFYGCGYVERNWNLYRVLSGGPDTEQYPTPLGHEWYGIPPTPMWLSWFGKPYKELVAKSFNTISPTVTERGAFVRSGEKPMNWDELKAITWNLPKSLLAKEKEDLFLKRISKRDHAHYTALPADFIPDLAS